jgi:hypothetical protein
VLMTQIRTSAGKMEVLLSGDARAELQRIGEGLDARQPVRVKDGGIVILDPEPTSTAVQEKKDEQRQGTRGPAAGSRQGPTGRKGSPRRSRPAGARPWLRSLSAAYQQQLEDVQGAYPGATLAPDEHGVWLSARSQLLAGLGREAIFLIAFPDTPEVEPRGWAFWSQRGQIEWIGDRHTNFFDGSVCAYSSANDQAWAPGGDLRTLLDLYSVWALRHLHLAVIRRWAGRQYALLDPAGRPFPYYRLVEFNDGELCSCDSGARYGRCCKPQDLTHDFLTAKRQFEALNQGRGIRDRRPPDPVMRCIRDGAALPSIYDVHEPLRFYLSQNHESGQWRRSR